VKRRAFLNGAIAALAAQQLASCARAPDPGTANVGLEPQLPGQPLQAPIAEANVASIKAVANQRGCYFGTAVQATALNTDGILRRAIINDCSSLTPEWALKWDALAPTPGGYRFDDMDRIAQFASNHGMKLRGHTLLWHRSIPRWAADRIAGTRQWTHVMDYFDQVIHRYGDQITEWDVLNEPIEPKDGLQGLRNNLFLQAFGPDYIEWAFWGANERAPNSRKLINEYGLEYNTPYEGQRRLALLRLLERLKRKGVPVDGVGLQAHLDLRKGTLYQDGIYGLIRDIAELGLDVVITELDVTEADIRLPVEQRDMLVADETRRYLDIVFDFENVVGVNTWGLSDSYSWLRANGRMLNRGLPYDAAWRRKPMYEAIRTAFA
jgi:endo-1,4-beta-xylanase